MIIHRLIVIHRKDVVFFVARSPVPALPVWFASRGIVSAIESECGGGGGGDDNDDNGVSAAVRSSARENGNDGLETMAASAAESIHVRKAMNDLSLAFSTTKRC